MSQMPSSHSIAARTARRPLRDVHVAQAAERPLAAGDEPDRDAGERREQDRGAAVDDGDPRRGVGVVEVLDPQQVRGDHAEHGEAAREIDSGDALRAVQPVPARREPASGLHPVGRTRYSWRRSHTSSAFCACSRFSASSQTTLCGPSITSASTS